MKILTVIGARPQFIKAAAVSRALTQNNGNFNSEALEIILHTGQHYDYNMSRSFFECLHLPEPAYNLNAGSGSHGLMTATMLKGIESILLNERPDWVLVYGDTNSTLAGALAASKLHIPVAHVEAGLRSFNRRMPEEINRVVVDHISDLLFVPTDTAVKHLNKEGIFEGVIKVGDVMLDSFIHLTAKAAAKSRVLDTLSVTAGNYYLATVHRQENTENVHRLSNIFSSFEDLSQKGKPVIVPLHPRTRKTLQQNDIRIADGADVRVVDPVDYLDMIQLEANAALILTDSGGVQKEAYFAGVPCITLRDETEWVETVEAGVNFLAGAEKKSILDAFKRARHTIVKLKPGIYGDGHAAEKIVDRLLNAN